MTGATSRGVTPTVAKVTEPEVLAVSEELLRDLVGRAGDELRQSQISVHAQIEVEPMCFLGGCPPVGSDVHLGADIELGPIETVAGSSLGFPPRQPHRVGGAWRLWSHGRAARHGLDRTLGACDRRAKRRTLGH